MTRNKIVRCTFSRVVMLRIISILMLEEVVEEGCKRVESPIPLEIST